MYTAFSDAPCHIFCFTELLSYIIPNFKDSTGLGMMTIDQLQAWLLFWKDAEAAGTAEDSFHILVTLTANCRSVLGV